MLKGTGTRASKSRLTTFAGARESSHTTFRSRARKEDKKDPLALVPKETKVEGKERRKERERPLLDLFFQFFACCLSESELMMCREVIGGERKERPDGF